jgi:hypothetical protein
MAAQPRRHGFLGGRAHTDHELEVVALDDVVEDAVPVPDDGGVGILREVAEVVAVLAEDRVAERVEEQVRPRDTEVAEEVLHA